MDDVSPFVKYRAPFTHPMSRVENDKSAYWCHFLLMLATMEPRIGPMLLLYGGAAPVYELPNGAAVVVESVAAFVKRNDDAAFTWKVIRHFGVDGDKVDSVLRSLYERLGEGPPFDDFADELQYIVDEREGEMGNMEHMLFFLAMLCREVERLNADRLSSFFFYVPPTRDEAASPKRKRGGEAKVRTAKRTTFSEVEEIRYIPDRSAMRAEEEQQVEDEVSRPTRSLFSFS
jgi:hypothetical protein